MLRKQLATICAFVVLLVLHLNISFTVAAFNESEPAETEDASRSYFGYRPRPKDSYKKLVEDVHEFTSVYESEWMRMWSKIEAVHKKLHYRKDKDGHGGYGYNNMQKMQQLMSEQKAAIDALRSELSFAPTV